MNKKIVTSVVTGVIILLAIVASGIFWEQSENTKTQQTNTAIQNQSNTSDKKNNNTPVVRLFDMRGIHLKQTDDTTSDFPINIPLSFRISFDKNSKIQKEVVNVSIEGANNYKISDLKDSPENFRLSPFEYIATYTPKNTGNDVIKVFVENKLIYTTSINIFEYFQSKNGIYSNEKYNFSIKYPKNWYYTQLNDGYTKEDFITFTNTNKPMGKYNDCPNCLAFFVSIYDKSNPEFDYYKKHKINTENKYDKKEKIALKEGSFINMYVLTYDNKDTEYIQDLILPVATAYYENEKYALKFNIASEIPSGPDGQEKLVNFMRESLKTLAPLK